MSLPSPRPWPVPLPQWFWPWAAWRLAGTTGPRPPAPKRIPAWAWLRLSYMKARPRVPASQASKVPFPFNGRGIFLLEPRGGTEDLAAWKEAGGTYVLLNLAYRDGGNWDTHRARAKQLGLAVVPWQYIRTRGDAYEVEETANDWGSVACAHNLEAEAMTTVPPEDLAWIASTYPASRVRAVITEPWMQNGAGWQHLGKRGWVAMPECFLNANPAWDPTVLCAHAKAEGMPLAVPVFGWGKWSDAATYVPPAQYLSRWNGPYAVYPGDGKEQRYGEWQR